MANSSSIRPRNCFKKNISPLFCQQLRRFHYGAAAGGLIVHYYDPFTTLALNAIAYLISGILIYFSTFKKKSRNLEDENILAEISRGFVYLKKKKSILLLGLTTIMSDVAIWGSLSVLTIALSKNIFNEVVEARFNIFYGISACFQHYLSEF